MNGIIIFVLICVCVPLIYLLFQLNFWGKVFGIEYFEEKYTFQKPVTINYIRDLFLSLNFQHYTPKLAFYVDFKVFYSIGHKGFDDWSSWLPLENKPNKKFDGYDIRYRNAWTINIFGPDLSCTVYYGDSTMFYEDESYPEIRLVGWGIIKFPWNARRIRKERKFLQDMISFLNEAEQKNIK